MTNFENGVLNYVLTQAPRSATTSSTTGTRRPFSQLAMVTTSLIVWGAIPFVVVTVYAGLAQVPHELVEAAEIDGARPWRVFRDVTVPDPEADLPDPDEPLDHLGLRRLHAAVPADRPVAASTRRTT